MKTPKNHRLIVNMKFYLILCSALFLVNCSSKTEQIDTVYGQTGTSLFQLKNKQSA